MTQLYPRHEPSPKHRFISHIASFLIFVGITIPLVFYGPLLIAEGTYRFRKMFSKSATAYYQNPYQTIVDQVPDPAFSLFIPKISAESRVVENVDPWDKKAYMAALTNGVAHAQNTSVPGNGSRNIFLFAHSTDSPLNAVSMNAVFYLLRELEHDDEIFLVYHNKPYRYIVFDKKIVDPTETSFLTADNEEHQEQVILQTCWPPGTTDNRLLIFARPANTEHADSEAYFDFPHTITPQQGRI